MELFNWLQSLGRDANLTANGFQPSASYILTSVFMPVVFGLVVGLGLRLIEWVFGVELGKGGRH